MPGQEWTLGSQHGFPERSCCLCGKAGAYVESGSMAVGNVHGSRGQPLQISLCLRQRQGQAASQPTGFIKSCGKVRTQGINESCSQRPQI